MPEPRAKRFPVGSMAKPDKRQTFTPFKPDFQKK
jgi:hypothetical protein